MIPLGQTQILTDDLYGMIGEVFEIVEWGLAAFAGWRFIFSPAYRRTKFEEWRSRRWYAVVWDVLCGICGIGFSIFIGYLIWILLGFNR